MEAVKVKKVFNLVLELLDVPYPGIWTVCDKEADVLYLNFKKPSHTDDSELTDDDLVIRYEKGAVIEITVLNASRRGVEMGAAYDIAYPIFTTLAAHYMKFNFMGGIRHG